MFSSLFIKKNLFMAKTNTLDYRFILSKSGKNTSNENEIFYKPSDASLKFILEYAKISVVMKSKFVNSFVILKN